MERVTTATRWVNKFGNNSFGNPRDGFRGTPPDQTQVSSEMFDAWQETIARAIEGQLIELDSGNLDQLTDAINGWSTWTAPAIPSGATLTIETGGSLISETGSTVAFGARVTITETVGTQLTALQVANESATDPALICVNLSTNRALLVQNNSGAACAARVENSLGGCAIEGTNNGAGPTATLENAGAGPAGAFTNSDASSTVTFTNNGAGPAVTCDGALVAPLVDTVDADGTVSTGEVRFYEDLLPLFAGGIMQWDGRAIVLGIGTAAPRMAQPLLSYVPGPIVTGAFTNDTGASKSLDMRIGEKAKVVVHATMKSDAVGQNIRFTIEANAGLIGNVDSFYEPIAGASAQSVTRVVEYTAVANGLVSFKARYGANAGNTTANDVSIEVSHI